MKVNDLLDSIFRKTKTKSDKEKLLFAELIEQNSDLVDLVKETTESYLKELRDEDEDFSLFETETSLEWLKEYQNKYSYIKEVVITGYPDTFIEAACVINSISEKSCIKSKYCSENPEAQVLQAKFFFLVNVEIAFRVALKMISNPTTYSRTGEDTWIDVEHKAVNITIPDGIIENSPLRDRIFHNLYTDYLRDEPISTMQLSNMLHLIYLYCEATSIV